MYTHQEGGGDYISVHPSLASLSKERQLHGRRLALCQLQWADPSYLRCVK